MFIEGDEAIALTGKVKQGLVGTGDDGGRCGGEDGEDGEEVHGGKRKKRKEKREIDLGNNVVAWSPPPPFSIACLLFSARRPQIPAGLCRQHWHHLLSHPQAQGARGRRAQRRLGIHMVIGMNISCDLLCSLFVAPAICLSPGRQCRVRWRCSSSRRRSARRTTR